MDAFFPRERLLRKFEKKEVERSPVICPGGMMNSAIVEIMNATGHTLPAAHTDAALMADLAEDFMRYTGFENLGVPFCMTVETEALGSEINFGTLECEPKIQKERYASVADVPVFSAGIMEKAPRAIAIADAISILSKRNPDVPTIGSLTGPVSTSASLVDPMPFSKQLRRDRENSHRVLENVADRLIDYAAMMVETGASAISIADPTATGEILGPKMFEEYAVRYLNRVVDGIHALGVPVIVHICGKMDMVVPQVAQLHADAISVDAFVSLKKIKESMRHVIACLEERGLRKRFKVIIGGKPCSPAFARKIGADGYSSNAAGAVRLCKRLMDAASEGNAPEQRESQHPN